MRNSNVEKWKNVNGTRTFVSAVQGRNLALNMFAWCPL